MYFFYQFASFSVLTLLQSDSLYSSRCVLWMQEYVLSAVTSATKPSHSAVRWNLTRAKCTAFNSSSPTSSDDPRPMSVRTAVTRRRSLNCITFIYDDYTPTVRPLPGHTTNACLSSPPNRRCCPLPSENRIFIRSHHGLLVLFLQD